MVVVDAANEDEVRLVAEAVALAGADAIAVGSAGLARELANTWRTGGATSPTGATNATRATNATSAGPALAIVTSLNDVARRQARALISAGACHHEPAAGDLIDDEAWNTWSARVLEGFDRARLMVLLVTTPDVRTSGLSTAAIARRLADLASRSVKRGISGVVVTGGDGARAVVDGLQATGIDLRAEVVPSVPIGTLIGGSSDGLPIVTKAGGFGDDDTLLRAVEAIRCFQR